MAASKISAKSPVATDKKSLPSTSSASSQSGRDASATAAYERYLRLPELAKLARSREFPQWRNESVLKPALQGLEITFRFVSLSLSDARPYANHRQWKRRLESLASREIELIAALCEEEGGASAPVADLSLCAGVLSRGHSSQEVWKAPGEAASVVARTSEASLLPRLAAWEKSEDVAAKILFQIETHMQGCAFTLGLGEPNLAGKPTLEYDLVVRPFDLHTLKRCSKADQEDQVLCTIYQILESWLSVARELLALVEQRIEAEYWAAAAADCWLMERIWKLLSDVEDLLLLMDPDDFLQLKSQLAIKAASGGEEAVCFLSEALMHVTGSFKDLRQSVPRILGVEADPNGGPRVQNAAMDLFHSRRRGGEEAGKVELLQAMQAVEAALKRFFFAYRQVAAAVMGSLEVIGNRAVYVPAESLDPLTQMFLETPYYPSLDAAKTFLGDYWRRQSDLGGVPAKAKW